MASYDPQPAGRAPAQSPRTQSDRPRRDDEAPLPGTRAGTRDPKATPKTGQTIFTDWASL